MSKKYINEIFEGSNEELKLKLMDFFKHNPQASHDDVYNFIGTEQLNPNKINDFFYKILGSFFGAGRAKEFEGDYDPKELEIGIKIEMEHTSCPLISERIAKDHLAEIPDYYTRLVKMEKEAGFDR